MLVASACNIHEITCIHDTAPCRTSGSATAEKKRNVRTFDTSPRSVVPAAVIAFVFRDRSSGIQNSGVVH